MSTHGMVQVAPWTHRLVPLSSVQVGMSWRRHCIGIAQVLPWRVWSSTSQENVAPCAHAQY